ncbi:MAG TPA: efflux RND transporter periplasmic adaptor subunit [Gammaproteobacteria bacterium]|nr:efflux RND transporter periplasmic adaptor subunit [Gammaproteobacteria bacterium]
MIDKHLVRRLIVLVAFLAVLFVGIFGWHAFVTGKIEQAMAKAGQQRTTVSAQPVKEIKWPAELQATATLKAIQGAMLTPQLPGMVTSIHFHSGSTVKKGQLLVQLNDANQRAKLIHDESALKLAKTELAQQRSLYKRHNVSQLSYQQAQTSYTQARAAVSADHATIAKLQVRAPFTGHLGLRQVSLGQYLATTTPVVDIQQWNPIHAVFQVPQQQLARLHSGEQVLLSVAGIGNKTFKGKVSAIGAQVESGTRNVQVQATLDNPGFVLRPGMYGQATVKTGQARQVLVVPDSAVTYNTYGSYVYVVEKTKKGLIAKERNVKTGESRNGLTVVTRGLKASDKVVTAGQVKLHPGAAVTLAPSGNSAAKPMAPAKVGSGS